MTLLLSASLIIIETAKDKGREHWENKILKIKSTYKKVELSFKQWKMKYEKKKIQVVPGILQKLKKCFPCLPQSGATDREQLGKASTRKRILKKKVRGQ